MDEMKTAHDAIMSAGCCPGPENWPDGKNWWEVAVDRIRSLEAALAEAREDTARLAKAREILFAYTDNEITADPWWCVVRNGSFGSMVVLEGPFFSRERAEALRNARLYEYGAKSYVYCFSGHRSQHYKELRAAIGAPDRAAIDAARKTEE